MENKTEKATPKKLRDAQKKGQVVKSKELVQAFVIAATFIVLYFVGWFFIERFQKLMVKSIEVMNNHFGQAVTILIKDLLLDYAIIMAPLCIAVIVVATAANMFHSGVVFSLETVKPDMEKVNPVKGVKNLFTLKNLIEMFKAMIKVGVLTWFIWYVCVENMRDILNLRSCGSSCILPLTGALLLELFFYSSASFFVLAILDFFFQKAQFLKSMKMSIEEVKKEFKEVEGNADVKRKRFELYQDLINQGLANDIEGSSVVVTNPTHVAVGIFYEKEKVQLPVVMFKETGDIAQAAKEKAKELGVPIMENVPLARGLLKDAEVKEYIPSEFIEPVVEVLKWVQSLDSSDSPT